jgi:hypothetical protein
VECGRRVEYPHREALCFECLPPCTVDETSFARRLSREGPMRPPPKSVDGFYEVG